MPHVYLGTMCNSGCRYKSPAPNERGFLYNICMKRLIQSLIGGVIIPLADICIAGPLSLYIQNRKIQIALEMPFRWPRYAYYLLSPASSKPSLYFDDNSSLIVVILCDIALYALITYIILWMLSSRKRAASLQPQLLPPPPPSSFS